MTSEQEPERLATGGPIVSGVHGDTPPPWITGCRRSLTTSADEITDAIRYMVEHLPAPPEGDRIVASPEAMAAFRQVSAPPYGPPSISGLHLTGTPIYIDASLPAGQWEYRDGDRVISAHSVFRSDPET